MLVIGLLVYSCRHSSQGDGERSGDSLALTELSGLQLDERIAENPHDGAALETRVKVRMEGGQYDGALADLDHLESMRSLSKAELLDRANLEMKLGLHDRAMRDYERALTGTSDKSLYYNARGTVLLERGDLRGAALALDTAILGNPRFADAWYNRGTVLYQLGNMDEAEFHFQKAHSLEPGHSKALSALGFLFQHIKADTVGAKWYFEQAVKSDAGNGEAWYGLGNISFGDGKWAAAVSNYDAALRADSAYADAWANRGLALVRLGRAQDAEESYDAALAFNPQLGGAWAMRGLLRCQRGDRQGGCGDFLQAKTLGVRGVQAEMDRWCF